MPSAKDNIKHLVLVMMENRSFDHFFGFLQSDDYKIKGLSGNESNPVPDGTTAKVSKGAQNAGDFWPDPGHDLLDVNEQIFGNRNGTGTANMSGFVSNYAAHTNNNLKKARKIMKCFDPAQIPVLTTLAKEYAICDQWYSSVPGPTLPNRAYVHYGTSMGRVDMSPLWGGNFKSVFELLDTQSPRVACKVYYQDSTSTQTIDYLRKNQGRFFGTFKNFTDDCKNNSLPTYCVVEPKFNNDDDFAANDQHPDHDVAEGERFITDVYNAIRKNKTVWESTLLVIVYDEHGGLYDHLVPPATVNPDGKNCNLPFFDFKRLGVRVPAVLVSPYIERGTIISDVFDHTSVIATTRKLFTKGYPANALTERDRQANTFESCLTLSAPRTDTLKFPKPAKPVAAPDGMGLLAGDAATLKAKPQPKRKPVHQMSEFQLAMLQQGLAIESELPEKLQSHKTIRSFKTEHDVSVYLRDLQKRLTSASDNSGTKKVNGRSRAKARTAGGKK